MNRYQLQKIAQHLENVKTLGKLTRRELTRAIRDAIIAESDAIKQYETVADSTDDTQSKRLLQDIADEEKVHIGELQQRLSELLPDEKTLLEEGAAEVNTKKASYLSHISLAERAGCVRMGMMLKLAEHGILPSEFTKSALVTEIGKAILGISLVAGVPVGAAAHLLNRKIVERRGKERELQEKIKYYRSATQGLERGLADELSPVKEEASTVGDV